MFATGPTAPPRAAASQPAGSAQDAQAGSALDAQAARQVRASLLCQGGCRHGCGDHHGAERQGGATRDACIAWSSAVSRRSRRSWHGLLKAQVLIEDPDDACPARRRELQLAAVPVAAARRRPRPVGRSSLEPTSVPQSRDGRSLFPRQPEALRLPRSRRDAARACAWSPTRARPRRSPGASAPRRPARALRPRGAGRRRSEAC